MVLCVLSLKTIHVYWKHAEIFMDNISICFKIIQLRRWMGGNIMKENCPWFHKCWHWIMGSWGLFVLFSFFPFLLLYIFEITTHAHMHTHTLWFPTVYWITCSILKHIINHLQPLFSDPSSLILYISEMSVVYGYSCSLSLHVYYLLSMMSFPLQLLSCVYPKLHFLYEPFPWLVTIYDIWFIPFLNFEKRFGTT